MLTQIQFTILDIIERYQNEYKSTPVIGTMSIAFDYANSNGIYYNLDVLIANGYIKLIERGNYVIIKKDWRNDPIELSEDEKRIESAKKYYADKFSLNFNSEEK